MTWDSAVQVALIGAVVTVLAALLTLLTNTLQSRIERRRVRHEENRWAFELNSEREMELHRMRLRTYPEVFDALGKLSSVNIRRLTPEELQALAEQFNRWAYGEPGLCMLPDTRTALLIARDRLLQLSRRTTTAEQFLRGPRTDLVELMRRDVNHDWSQWREYKDLIRLNRERMEASLNDSTEN